METDYFVKFGNPVNLFPEIKTQKYLFNRAMSDPGHNVLYIPCVVHSFKHSETMYLVMEVIKLLPTSADFIAKVTATLVWLARVLAPPNHMLGLLEGSCI